MRRLAPVFVLFSLSPFVAEFLLGDFPLTYLPLLFVLAPMYGGGAVLIRELTRRAGRGWPTIIVLALAFGLLEEALVTESLFNPGYAGAHLLDRGFVPSLGIAIPWTLFVLTLHTVWSISTPVSLVEGALPQRRTTPWLHAPGLIVVCLVFVAGVFAITAGSYQMGDHFAAPWPRLAVSAALVVVLILVAFRLPKPAPADDPRPAPSPWWVFALGLAGGAVFMLGFRSSLLWLGVFLLPAAFVVVAVLAWRWSRRTAWGEPHRFALTAAAVLTYTWHSFGQGPVSGGGNVVLVQGSHVVFALVALAILAWRFRRLGRPAPDSPAPQDHQRPPRAAWR